MARVLNAKIWRPESALSKPSGTGDKMKVYGIKNCDTVKKARRFLDG